MRHWLDPMRYFFWQRVFLTILALCLFPTMLLAKEFIKGPYSPVGITFADDSGQVPDRLLLLGGSRNGTWFRHTSLPIMVQGTLITAQNAMDFDTGEDVPCETPLASSQTMELYTIDGRIGQVQADGTVFFTHPSSGEIFIATEFANPKYAGRGLIVAVNGKWNAMPVKTSRTEEDGSITFSTTDEHDNSFASVVLSKTKSSEGEVNYKGEVVVQGKIFDAGNFYTDDPQEIAGFFIDLNGDSRMEFIIHIQGIAGSASVFSIAPEGVTEVMNLDFGD